MQLLAINIVKPQSKSKTKPRVDFVFLRHNKNKNNPHLKFITFSLLRRLIFCIQSNYSLTKGFTREKIFRENLQEKSSGKSSGKIFSNFLQEKILQEIYSGIIFRKNLQKKSAGKSSGKIFRKNLQEKSSGKIFGKNLREKS